MVMDKDSARRAGKLAPVLKELTIIFPNGDDFHEVCARKISIMRC